MVDGLPSWVYAVWLDMLGGHWSDMTCDASSVYNSAERCTEPPRPAAPRLSPAPGAGPSGAAGYRERELYNTAANVELSPHRFSLCSECKV